jgi:cellulose synthase/poly-beta-1,6-N-acetylglucosamine synthase-like glycosyltransferase
MALLAASAGLVIYTFGIYPLLVRAFTLLHRRPARIEPQSSDGLPSLTVVVVVHNEGRQMRALLDSLLELDYPVENRQILVVSDASTDDTDAIVSEYAASGIELFRTPERGGKTAAENAARGVVRGSIVVCTDASIRIQPGALRQLVGALRDPSIGVASGRDISVANQLGDPNSGESGFVGFEMWLRDLETELDGIVGASGCLYAIRNELHQYDLPPGLSRDFGAALVAREHGFRSASVHDAVCYVPRTESLRREFRRKVRTISRGINTLVYKRHLLNPFRFGWFSWFLFSHKLCRWLVPVALFTGLLATLFLGLSQTWARVLGLTAAAGAALAVLGWFWPQRRPMPRLVGAPAFLAAANLAGLLAWWSVVTGKQMAVWEPTRRELVQQADPGRDSRVRR